MDQVFEKTNANVQTTIGETDTSQRTATSVIIQLSFEITFENTQWSKVKQMQPIWICIPLSKQFKDTFKNAKSQNQINAVTVTMHPLGEAI